MSAEGEVDFVSSRLEYAGFWVSKMYVCSIRSHLSTISEFYCMFARRKTWMCIFHPALIRCQYKVSWIINLSKKCVSCYAQSKQKWCLLQHYVACQWPRCHTISLDHEIISPSAPPVSHRLDCAGVTSSVHQEADFMKMILVITALSTNHTT